MTRILCIATMIMMMTSPARPAMEPDEIMVRLATGLSLKGTAYERRQIRKAKRSARYV